MSLTLIRGIPGSGKSTLAKRLLLSYEEAVHYEADMYFVKDGVYKYISDEIPNAHMWCQQKTFNSLRNNMDVIVSNTFVKINQMQPYIDMARMFAVRIQVIECKGYFGSIHNVPVEAIKRFKDNWESYHG